jgi:hypothetical protein
VRAFSSLGVKPRLREHSFENNVQESKTIVFDSYFHPCRVQASCGVNEVNDNSFDY